MKVLFLKKYPEYFIADKQYLHKRNTYLLQSELPKEDMIQIAESNLSKKKKKSGKRCHKTSS